MQRSELLSRAGAVILWVSVVCLSAGCATPSGTHYVHESYALGLEHEKAKDYKAAIPFFDEAIHNFDWFPEWMRRMQLSQQVQLSTASSFSKAFQDDSKFLPYRAYRHRANCKKGLGDIAGQKADLELADKQKPLDMAMLDEIVDSLNQQEAAAAGSANRASVASLPTEDVRGCLTATYENTCKQTIELQATGSGQCSGPVRRVIEPGRMATVGFGCMLSGVTVQFVQ